MRYKLQSQPPLWVSAHSQNEYRLRLPQSAIYRFYNINGQVGITLSFAFARPVQPGDKIYITDGIYKGYQVIKTVANSLSFILTTNWRGISPTPGLVFHVDLPTISIYKGYKLNELMVPWIDGILDLFTIQPYELVGTFVPEAGPDGYLTFDIGGYLKTVLSTPYKPAQNPDEPLHIYEQFFILYTPMYYNKVTILVNNQWLLGTHYAANASITTKELNTNFVDTGRALGPLLQTARYFNMFGIADYINYSRMEAIYT